MSILVKQFTLFLGLDDTVCSLSLIKSVNNKIPSHLQISVYYFEAHKAVMDALQTALGRFKRTKKREVPHTSDGAERRVLLRQSSCITSTPAVEIMYTPGPGPITYVYQRIRNGLQIQRHRTRVTCTVQSIIHTERSWVASRTTRCREKYLIFVLYYFLFFPHSAFV